MGWNLLTKFSVHSALYEDAQLCIFKVRLAEILASVYKLEARDTLLTKYKQKRALKNFKQFMCSEISINFGSSINCPQEQNVPPHYQSAE